MTAPPREGAESRRQVLVWLERAASACLEGRFITALNDYSRALSRCRDHRIDDLHGAVCRDLGYIYLHHGQLERARELFEEGLALAEVPFEVRFGLLANLVSSVLLQKDYEQALAWADHAINRFRDLYPDFSQAPPELAMSFLALQSLQLKIADFCQLIRSGIDPQRLELTLKLAPAPWER